MSNWAKLDKDKNIVNVENASDEWIDNFRKENPDSSFTYVKQTNATKEAVIDGYYDETNKVFVAPKPFFNWILDNNFDWIPPISRPLGNFEWNQQTQEWIEFFPPTKPYPSDGQIYRWDVESKNWVVLD